jgi:hypothetical protein
MPVSNAGKLASLQAISLSHGMQGLWEKQNQNHFFSFVSFVASCEIKNYPRSNVQGVIKVQGLMNQLASCQLVSRDAGALGIADPESVPLPFPNPGHPGCDGCAFSMPVGGSKNRRRLSAVRPQGKRCRSLSPHDRTSRPPLHAWHSGATGVPKKH